MNVERLNKRIRFYFGGVWALYANIALFVLGLTFNNFTFAGAGPFGALAFFAAVAAIPVSWFGVALMITALTVFAQLGKARHEFKRYAKIGGWSAVVYAVLLFANPAYFLTGVFDRINDYFNAVSYGVVLLVIHVIVMRRARAILAA